MSRRFRLGGLLVLVAGTVLSAGQTPQPAAQQTPTFKAEVEYVEVDAIVTNQQGQFVRDLAKEDFRVLEDGKPQTIAAFAVVDIPVERYDRPLFASQAIEPDVKTNERPFDGRVYVMVLDDLHTEILRAQRVKDAAKQFIELHLGANDLMAIVRTAGPSSAGQEFTSNKRLLLAAVERMRGQKLEASTINRTNEFDRRRGLPPQSGEPGSDPRDLSDPEDSERAFNARSTLLTLKSVAEWFASVHGRRKAILFVSEGIDYDIYDLFGSRRTPTGSSSVISTTRDAINAAMRANVSIYGIDPRGLTNLGGDDITVQNYPADSKIRVGLHSLLNELRLSQDSLRVLSEETGGFASVNRNEFSSAYERIVADNSSYYVLAYYPTSVKRDGKFHKIDVRVTRPDLTVRARRGYLSPKGKPAAPPPSATRASVEVREALSSPLPVSGLTMRLFAAPFKGTAPNASVLVGVEMVGRALTLTPNNKVEVSYVAIDSAGKVYVNDDQVTMNLQPQTRGRVEQHGLRVLKRIDLPPGRYQLRVAGHDVAGGAVGSVIYDFEAPDFNKLRFSMSGLVLTARAGSATVTTRPDEQLKDVLPVPPVALRTFPQNDELVLFTEIYDSGATSPHRVDIVTTVTSDDGQVLFKTREERASSELQGSRGGYGYVARVPLKDLPPGSYVLQVEARSRLGEGAVASRQVQFKVTPQETAPAR